ncbi:MAG: DUF305 domain-containing protein [Gemmataceae bacterium]|nr:DUF305 domain-containing protein [Gemmataceae bacterium]
MNADHQSMSNKPYTRLSLMIVLSFVSMYVLMYAMVNTFANVYSSFNQVYMAGLMTAPMLVLEVSLMGMMYPNKKWNAALIAVGAVALVGFFALIRQQAAVGDKQFLRSMIPHHAGAILMAEQSDTRDPEIKKLVEDIITSQRAEIEQMKRKLAELDK